MANKAEAFNDAWALLAAITLVSVFSLFVIVYIERREAARPVAIAIQG